MRTLTLLPKAELKEWTNERMGSHKTVVDTGSGFNCTPQTEETERDKCLRLEGKDYVAVANPVNLRFRTIMKSES
jgi:hypothetical protein